jgi:Integrase core domain
VVPRHSSRPAKRRNGYLESFNGCVRDKCLNINLSWSRTYARVVISDWKEDYNQLHRRRAAGRRTAPEFPPARLAQIGRERDKRTSAGGADDRAAVDAEVIEQPDDITGMGERS